MSREVHVRICESVRVKPPRATRPFWVVLDIGMRAFSRQKLRLRGIDCPEMDTPEGKAAKKFVESLLRDVPELIVLTRKNDKYDRYEADVFIEDKTGAKLFVNNLLLEAGHAIRVES